MIEFAKTSDHPTVFRVTVTGHLSREEAEAGAQRFGELLAPLGGKPFRVLCDMRNMAVMPEGAAEVFMAAQNLAVQVGMERDAFIVTSATVRMQLNRLAKQGARFDKLGPLSFFSAEPAAVRFVEGAIAKAS